MALIPLTPFSARTQSVPITEIGTAAGAFPLSFADSGSNPVLVNGGEASMQLDVDGTTVHRWYQIIGQHTVFHQISADAGATWGSATLCTGLPSLRFPTVQASAGTFYMAFSDTGQNSIYLYSSSNGVAWTALNSGSPVCTHDATATDWRNALQNTGFDFDGSGNIHWTVECTASSGIYSQTSFGGYATSTLASPAFTLPAVPTFKSFSAPEVHWVAARNALLVIYCDLYGGITMGAANACDLGFKWAYPTNGGTSLDLTSPLYWADSEYSLNELAGYSQLSDPSLCFTPANATNAAILYYNFQQANGNQATLPASLGIGTITQLFDLVAGSAYGTGANSLKLAKRRQKWSEEINDPHVFNGSVAFNGQVTYSGGNLPVYQSAVQYTVISVGADGTHNLAFTWDGTNNVGYIQTAGSTSYPLIIQASTIALPTVASNLSVFQSATQYTFVASGKDGSHNVSLTYDTTNNIAYLQTAANAYPLSIIGSALGFFSATPAAQQTGGALTAGGSYTSNEESMLNKAYGALRAYGLLT